MTPQFRRALEYFLLVAAGIVGAHLLSMPGTSDVGIWLAWIQAMREHGLVAGYALSNTDYMPLSFVFLRAMQEIAGFLHVGDFIVLKSGMLFFAFLSAAVLAWWRRNVLLAAAFLWALLLNSAALGYLDVLYLPPLLLSLRAVERTQPAAAAFWFTVALSVKWQPALIAPFLLLHAVRQFQENSIPQLFPRLMLGAAAGAIPLLACFGLEPILRSLASALSHRALSFNALNLPWLVQWALAGDLPSGVPRFFLLPPPLAVLLFRTAFLATFVFFLGRLWRRARSFSDLLWLAAGGSTAYFTLNIGVHENHLFMAMILLFALAGTGSRLGTTLAVGYAAMANLNLVLFYGIDGHTPLLGGGTGPLAGIACLVNLALLICCVARERRVGTANHSCPRATGAS
ncbi:MAG TPA: hypothetical protein VHN79_04515 [Lacunisphaera sp.]|nr:hypothetical protein [Lacunisphaera sp.]